MAVKKDLSINYLGVKCENPFFLSSSPVGSNYEMEPDLSVIFKSYESALLLVLGKIGVYEGYAQHRFIVKGDFIQGMHLVRILYYVEAYLFPKFISKKILKEMPELTSTKLNAYFHLLF